MKKIYSIIIILLVLRSTLAVAQPALGMTTFFTTTTTALQPNTSCVVTKTTSLSGWLFSVSSTSNCGMNWTSTTGGDGRIQYLVGFGTVSQLTFGSNDGSEFALQNLTWGVSTSSWVAKPMQFIGYKNGSAVPGATLNATTPSGTGILNTVVITFTGNSAFGDVDNVYIIPTTTCNSILFLEQITIGAAGPACNNPTLTSSGSSNVFCNGQSTGSATMTASGGAPFTYTWSPSGGNAATATGLSAGIYTCVVTNSCGATASQTVLITEPTALTTNTAVTNALCNGGLGSATVTASGGTGAYSYTWSSGPTTSVEPTLLAGIYTVKVTDANSCSRTNTITINQPSSLVTSTAVTNVACNGGSNGVGAISSSGGAGSYTYLWSNGASTSLITGLMAGVYTATVTDANNCKSSKSITITQPSAIVTSTAVTNVACNGGSNGVGAISVSGGAGSYTYLWSNGASTSLITGLLAGVYTATVTDANSCTAVKSAIITQPSALVTSTAVTNVACNGGNGSASVTASGGTGAYTYLWSNGATTSAISGVPAGAYSATVTDANTCTSIKSAVITQPSAIAITTAVTNVACNGGNGSATITASGGTGAYTYLWSNGATTSAISGVPAGAYSATVTDANTCTSIKSAVITQPSSLATTTAVTNVACNGGNGSATITASGGTGSYTYLWSGGTTSAVITTLAGVYTATVTDANNCKSVKAVTITQPSALATNTSVTNAACNGSNGSATITASGGTGSYTYLWSNGSTSSVITNSASAYTATVTDANNCTSVKVVTISQPAAILTSTSVTNVACNGGTGSAIISASGGAGSFTYLWSNGSTSSAITGVLAGAYTATVTDANNCTTSKNAIITQPSALTTNTAVTNVACNGGNGSGTITASGGTGSYTYLWSNGSTSSAISNVPAGVYTATVTDANACSNVKSITITQPVALTTTTFVASSLCNGNNGTATITASGGTGSYTYLWSNGTASAVISALAGAYSATVTDANNCSSVKSVTITQPAALLSSTSATPVLCNGGTGIASITASGGTGPYTYVWSNGANSSTLSALAGAYTATVTDANNCSSVKTVTITQPSSLITSTAVTNVACNGGNGSATITASGGTGSYTYLWSNGATSSAIGPVPAGVYTATVTDANACSNTKPITITQPAALTTNTFVANALCNGINGSATVTATGGTGSYTYLWSGGSTSSVASLPAGAYSATVTDANNCTSTRSVAITQPSALTTTTTVTNALCNGSNGTAGITAMGGTGAYTYLWSGGATTSSVSLLAGAYTATVTDANNCKSSKSVTITQPAALVTTTAATNILCNGGMGSAAITATGGTGAYSYLWSNGATAFFTSTLAGIYTATVTDANNCKSIKSVAITQPSALTSTTSVNNVLCNGGNGSATVTASGGVSPYSYSWTSGTSTSSVALAAGVYTVTVSDTHSCTSIRSVTITQPSAMVTTQSVDDAPCHGNAGSATLTTTGGTGPYTYSWGGGITGAVFSATAGIYSVVVTDANNCLSNDIVIIDEPSALTLNISTTNSVVCAGTSVTLNASGSGGTGALVYNWSTGSAGATQVVTPSLTNTYTVSLQDANGCTLSKTLSVFVNTLPVLSVSNYTICSGNSVNIIPSGANTYSISGNTFSVSPSSTTSYTITGTSSAGCQAATGVVATIFVNITPTVTVNSAVICSGNSAVLTPGGANTYTITGNNFTVMPVSTTNYSVAGTASNGCISANTAVATITVNTTPTVSVTDATICSGTTLTLSPSGANTYSITGNTFIVSPNITTTYSITGTSVEGCVSDNAIATISVNTTPTLSLNNGAVCPGYSHTFTPSGADTYTITGGSYVVTPSLTSSYTLTGTALNGCAAANPAIATVSVANTLTLSVSGPSTVCEGNSVVLTANGASTYTWNTGITSNTISLSPSVTTTYSLLGASSNCSNTAVVSLSVLNTPSLSVNSEVICSGASAIITPSGAATYTISGNTFTVSPTISTSYSVTGTSAQGCLASNIAISTISVNTTPTVTVNDGVICAGTSTVITPSGAATYTISSGTFTVSPMSNTSFTITGTSANGCISSEAVAQVTVNTNPTITVNSGIICPGSTFTLVPAGAVTYTIAGNNTPVVSPSITTSYSISGTSADGCISSMDAVATVTVVNSLTVSVSGNTTICSGETATLIANGANTYSWSTNATTDSVVLNPATNTTYTVYGGSGTCADTVEVSIQVNALPVITTASSASIICIGETSTLSVNGAVNYTWSNSQTGAFITISPATAGTETFAVTGTDANGCANTVTVQQIVDNCTGISNLHADALIFEVYPNPNNGQFTVKTKENTHITIVNALGAVVYEQTMLTNTSTVNMEQLKNGLYFIKAIQNNTQNTIRFIKQ